jgi:hypothetical protein
MKNLTLLDDPGRVRSQITSVVCQIQRFDFDCNLVVTRKVIIRIPPGLERNPLYRYVLNLVLNLVCTHVLMYAGMSLANFLCCGVGPFNFLYNSLNNS